MKKCAYCESTVLFGRKSEDGLRYCNDRCLKAGTMLSAAKNLPKEAIRQQVSAVFGGVCPKCSGPGPVDVHKSYRVWSLILMTSWVNPQHVCCKRCARKRQAADALFSLFLGWWGFPWGLLMTPVQVIRNLGALARPDVATPSAQLDKFVRLTVGARLLELQSQAVKP